MWYQGVKSTALCSHIWTFFLAQTCFITTCMISETTCMISEQHVIPPLPLYSDLNRVQFLSLTCAV